jgi:hypothetical protein
MLQAKAEKKEPIRQRQAGLFTFKNSSYRKNSAIAK